AQNPLHPESGVGCGGGGDVPVLLPELLPPLQAVRAAVAAIDNQTSLVFRIAPSPQARIRTATDARVAWTGQRRPVHSGAGALFAFPDHCRPHDTEPADFFVPLPPPSRRASHLTERDGARDDFSTACPS